MWMQVCHTNSTHTILYYWTHTQAVCMEAHVLNWLQSNNCRCTRCYYSPTLQNYTHSASQFTHPHIWLSLQTYYFQVSNHSYYIQTQLVYTVHSHPITVFTAKLNLSWLSIKWLTVNEFLGSICSSVLTSLQFLDLTSLHTCIWEVRSRHLEWKIKP